LQRVDVKGKASKQKGLGMKAPMEKEKQASAKLTREKKGKADDNTKRAREGSPKKVRTICNRVLKKCALGILLGNALLNVPMLVFSKLQVEEVPEQGREAAVYKKKDLVQLLDEGEEEKHVADGIVVNVEGDTVHSVKIKDGEVSVQVLKSHDDGYKLYRKNTVDFPEVSTCKQAVGGIILWIIDYM
jgi:hypothetical protein